MQGLEQLTNLLRRKNSVRTNHRIYCSEISKAFIIMKYPNLDNRYVHALNPDEPCVMKVFDKAQSSMYNLRVTAVSAQHCPGSVM